MDPNIDPKWMQRARSYIGVQEIPGEGSHPKIVEWLSLTTLPRALAQRDETAWCASFVMGMLKEAGITGTGLANARSYLGWGVPVDRTQLRRGDIGILPRGNSAWQGHVGFVESVDYNRGVVKLLGGNQRNGVRYEDFLLDRFLGFRRPREPIQEVKR